MLYSLSQFDGISLLSGQARRRKWSDEVCESPHYSAPAPPAPSSKPDNRWREQVGSPVVEHAWETLCGSIIQEVSAWETLGNPARAQPAPETAHASAGKTAVQRKLSGAGRPSWSTPGRPSAAASSRGQASFSYSFYPCSLLSLLLLEAAISLGQMSRSRADWEGSPEP